MRTSEPAARSNPSSFWGQLDEDHRNVIRSVAALRQFPADEQILREGDLSRSVYVLLSGRVKVVATAVGGHQAVLAVRDVGDVIGEMAGIEQLPRSATAIAVDPVSALWISADAFAQIVRDRPALVTALLRTVTSRLRYANLRRTEYGDTATAMRVAALLVELAERYGRDTAGGILIGLRISQQDMAGLVSASRETVIRSLRALRSDGLISTGRQRITVHDLETLRVVATTPVAEPD